MNTVELCNNPKAFKASVDWFSSVADKCGAQAIFSADARGFIWGSPVALQLGIPMYTVRKPGKMPGEVWKQEYQLEYGTDTVELSKNVPAGDRPVLIVDDVLATGGTADAIAKLVSKLGVSPKNITVAVVVNLTFLPGADLLRSQGYNVIGLVE